MRDALLGCFGWTPSPMPRGKEETTRIFLWMLKVPLIILVGIAAFGARDEYRFVMKNPELRQSPPYNPHVELAHLLTYVGLITIFPWLVISCYLVVFARGSRFLCIGLVDLGLAVVVAIGVGMQGVYLPATDAGCTLGKTTVWQVAGDHKSFFILAQELSNQKSPSDSCKYFVKDWQLAAGALFFQMLTAYIGIFFDIRETSLLNPYRPLIYLILAIFGPPVYFWFHVLPRMRFAYHWAIKSFLRLRGLEELTFHKPTPYIPRYHYDVANPKLQNILNIEHVLLELVSNLHYEDVINLSLASKAVREAVYPSRDLEHRVPKLKKYCCDEETKKACLYCNKKICRECKVEAYYPGLPGLRHVNDCQAYCPQCYYQHFSRRPQDYKKPCKCHASDRSIQLQDMCRTCSLKPLAHIQTVRHKRYQLEARDIAFGTCLPPGEKTKCGKCKNELKSGTRFWVCGNCKGECKSGIHPAFSGKQKERDVEMAEKGVETEQEGQGWRWSMLFKIHQ